jgi:hypothetical protein
MDRTWIPEWVSLSREFVGHTTEGLIHEEEGLRRGGADERFLEVRRASLGAAMAAWSRALEIIGELLEADATQAEADVAALNDLCPLDEAVESEEREAN